MASPGGLFNPNHGYAPYQEAADRGRARMSTLERIALALAGAGQGIQSLRPGVGPIGGALTGFSRGYILSNASKRAAEEYAMKQQQAEERRRNRERDDAEDMARIEARAKEKPETPQPWKPQTMEDVLMLEEEKAKIKAKYTPKKPPGTGATKAPAPAKPRAAVMNRIDLINQADVNNPEHRARLQQIIRNPATPEERDAALKRLEISPGFYRR